MHDFKMLYEIIYALAAREGREGVLFGTSAPAAREAFARSLACNAFPELWFEVPLSGEPWFDFHALTAHDDVEPGMAFTAAETGGHTGAFEWFAAREGGVRQLALSWDTGSGDVDSPAVQLLVSDDDPEVTCEFLEAAGRPDAIGAYRAFRERLPQGWFACYAGVFPMRPGHNLRVECIPERGLQHAYGDDPALLERDLRQVGLDVAGNSIVERCQLMARTPFQFEFQFDVEPDGSVGATFSASSRFACPPGESGWEPYYADGAAGELMRKTEAWGLADGRWRELSGAMFAKRISYEGRSCTAYCYPAFLKLRWRNGEPVDAKAYLIAGLQRD